MTGLNFSLTITDPKPENWLRFKQFLTKQLSEVKQYNATKDRQFHKFVRCQSDKNLIMFNLYLYKKDLFNNWWKRKYNN